MTQVSAPKPGREPGPPAGERSVCPRTPDIVRVSAFRIPGLGAVGTSCGGVIVWSGVDCDAWETGERPVCPRFSPSPVFPLGIFGSGDMNLPKLEAL